MIISPSRIWGYLVVATLLALTIAVVVELRNRDVLVEKLATAYPLYSHEFFSSLEGPFLSLPLAGSPSQLRQSFVSPDAVLYGVNLWLSPDLPGENRTVTLTLYGPGGEELRRAVENVDRENFYPFFFDPLEDSEQKPFSFSLEVAGGSPARSVKARVSAPNDPGGGSLRSNGMRRAGILVYSTLHPALWNAEKLRLFLGEIKAPLFIAVALVGLLTFRLYSVRAIYPVLLLAGLYTTIAFPPYSKVDEDAHFDYINAIYREHRLPIISQGYRAADLLELSREMGDPRFKLNYVWFGKRYIAVHPPLYYLTGSGVAALASLFTKSVAVRFFLLRLLGVLFSLVTAFFVVRSYDFLVSRSVIRRNDPLFFVIMGALFLSPGYQSALIPLNNDQLTVPLASSFLYLLTRMACGDMTVNSRRVALLSVLGALLFLTKVTTVHIVVLGGVLLLAKRKFRGFLGYVALFLCAISPWIMFNLRHYGAVFGSSEHLQVVGKTIDTQFHSSLVQLLHLSHEFVRGFLLSFQRDFMFDHAGSLVGLLGSAWVIAVYAGVVFLLYATAADLRRRYRRRESYRPTPWLTSVQFCFLILLANYLFITASTLIHHINIMMPRLMYTNILAVVFIVYLVVDEASGTVVRWASGYLRPGHQ